MTEVCSPQELARGWKLACDPANRGRQEGWFVETRCEAKNAPVPGIIQQVFPDYHGVAWYWCSFKPTVPASGRQRIVLRFGAVDYLAEVWLNGARAGDHEGGETPFELDVTGALKPGERNLLAVRVLNPTDEPIDGITLAETPHRNKFDTRVYQPGQSYNYGGIVQPVSLHAVPEVRVEDVFARPDTVTGRIAVTITVRNDTGGPASGQLMAHAAPASTGHELAGNAAAASFPCGESLHELVLSIPEPRLWRLEDPHLYRVTVAVEADVDADAVAHEYAVRCGFRDFRVEHGFFHLNGKRVFVRSTHTGNHFPISQIVPQDPDLLRRDLLYAKACGFNMVRFIAGAAWPEQLDFCDEIGLMVYQETLASWMLGDSPKMEERYDRSWREVIRRDRNHASVTIWGMLNETTDGPVFRHAVDALRLVRSLDETRLVLLGSGRLDADPAVGSVSNPGSREWEHVWGVESPVPPKVDPTLDLNPGGYVDRAGDAHVYPVMPQAREMTDLIRTLGADARPVFLSEYGIGSLFNVIDELARYEQAGAPEDLPDASRIRSMAEKLTADLERFGMNQLYPFPADLLRESQHLHVRQRRFTFDVVRSNPNLCGYNVTGMLDHGLTGEGLWTFWREWKPGIADALRDGWAPLRWSLFVEPLHAYAGRPVQVEAVLATEDVLAPGQYPALFRIFGHRGVEWEKHATVRIAERGEGPGQLAVPVLKETVELDLPAGEYVLAASLERGGAAAGDRRTFRVSDPAELPSPDGTLVLLGIAEREASWLRAHGCRCRSFEPHEPVRGDVILIGEPPPQDDRQLLWEAVRRRVQAGACAIFLSPLPFLTAGSEEEGGAESPRSLPMGEKVKARKFYDWLYHKECVAKQHPVFDGLQTGGILDWDYYGQLIPHCIFDCEEPLDEVIAAAFAVGYYCPGGYDSGVLVGSLRVGKGRVIFSALQVLEHVDRQPAADRLLLNLIRYGQRVC